MLFLPAGKSEGLVLVLLSLLCFLRWDNKHRATVDHTLEHKQIVKNQKKYNNILTSKCIIHRNLIFACRLKNEAGPVLEVILAA